MNETEKNLNEELEEQPSEEDSGDDFDAVSEEESNEKVLEDKEENDEPIEEGFSEESEEIIDESPLEESEEMMEEEPSEESKEMITEGINFPPIANGDFLPGGGDPPVLESEVFEEEETEEEETEYEESPEEEAARIERQVREYHKCLIEAALYASGKPLTIEILSTKLDIGKREIEELINELAFDYLDRSTALVIANVGDRYQMQIKPEYTENVSKFAEGGAIAEKYLRTLTVIALKQPILKSLLVKLRGSGAYEHVKYLEDEGLIEGKKKGRSSELTTTDKYAEMFGLPRDKQEMKRVMVAQLGLDEVKE